MYDDAVASSIYDTSIVWRLSVTGRNAHTAHTNKQTYIGEAEEAKEEKKWENKKKNCIENFYYKTTRSNS